ncbi:MAG: hypothetical protein JJU41_13675 [Bacteroidetes bacterium]|nr:hypothetical protein [Bacteroidota bacterium]
MKQPINIKSEEFQREYGYMIDDIHQFITNPHTDTETLSHIATYLYNLRKMLGNPEPKERRP